MTLDHDALEALCNAATPRPWLWSENEVLTDAAKLVATAWVEDIDDAADANANAKFIAAARAAVPELVAEVRALRAEISTARHEVWERQHEIEILTAERDANAGDLEALRAQRDAVLALCEVVAERIGNAEMDEREDVFCEGINEGIARAKALLTAADNAPAPPDAAEALQDAPRDHHDSHGYECCRCDDHPEGKPWGWNYSAWEAHWSVCPAPVSATHGEAEPLQDEEAMR